MTGLHRCRRQPVSNAGRSMSVWTVQNVSSAANLRTSNGLANGPRTTSRICWRNTAILIWFSQFFSRSRLTRRKQCSTGWKHMIRHQRSVSRTFLCRVSLWISAGSKPLCLPSSVPLRQDYCLERIFWLLRQLLRERHLSARWRV